MSGLDVSILVSWACWVFYPIAHRSPWGYWSTRQSSWYHAKRERLGWAFHESVYGTVWLIFRPLLIISLWGFTRTYDESSAMYILTLTFAFVAIGMGKIWEELFFDRRDAANAMILAILSSILYLCAGIFACLTDGTEWYRWVLAAFCFVAALWFFYHVAVCYVWAHSKIKSNV